MKNLRNKAYRALRWSEKYTKTDMVYLGKGGTWLGVNQVVAVLFGLVTSVALANLLPKESFGVYKFVLSGIALVAALSLTEMPAVLTRAIAQGYDGSLKKAFILNIKWSLAVFVGALALAVYYFVKDNSTLAISFLLAGSLSPFMSSGSLYSAFLQGKKDFKKSTYYGAWRNFIPSTSIIITIALTDNPIVLIASYFISSTIITIFFYRKTLSVYKPKENNDPNLIKNSRHLSFMNILALIAHHADKILIFNQLGAAPLAVYSFAIAPTREMGSVFTIVKRLAFPKFSTKSIEEIKKTMPRKIAVFASVGTLMALSYILIAPIFFSTLFPNYIESVPYSQVFALSLIFSPSILIGQILVSHMKIKYLYIVKTLIPIIQLLLIFSLLPLYGIWGIVFASLLTNLVNFLLFGFVYLKLR